MSNKTGIIQKNGKLYLNGVELGTGGGAQDASELIYNGETTVADALDALDTKIDNVADAVEVDTTDISGYGLLAQHHPDECRMLANAIELDRPGGRMVRFIWLADNHTTEWTLASDLLMHSKADFLAHSGDIIQENGSVNNYQPLYENLVNTPTKPSYVVLGNHDLTSKPLLTRYNGYIANNNHINVNSESFVQTPGFIVHSAPGKIYYSVTYTGYNNSECGWKAIFLFPPDGRPAPGNAQSADEVVTSDDQIAWFIAELAEASVNNLDVMCFTHVAPDSIDRTLRKDDWYEWQTGGGTTQFRLGGFCDVIDAFILGTTKTAKFPVGDTTATKDYTVSFPKKGFFIGWFCGHNHCDGFGWAKNHPFQFISVTDWYSGLYPVKTIDQLKENGSWVSYKSGVLFNYVNINLFRQRVDIMRCGNNELYDGSKHTTISYMYYKDATESMMADYAKTINGAVDRGRPQFAPYNTAVNSGDKMRIYFGCNSNNIGTNSPLNRLSGIELHYKLNDGDEQIATAAYDSSTPYVELTITETTTIKAWVAFKASRDYDLNILNLSVYEAKFKSYGGYGDTTSTFITLNGVEYACPSGASGNTYGVPVVTKTYTVAS